MKKFEVGDIVEAIRDHSNGDFKKGQRFEILGTKIITCKTCGKGIFCIDIGIPLKLGSDLVRIVHTCDNPCYGFMGTFTEVWFSSLSFKLVRDDSDKEIIEETKEQFKPITYTEVIKEIQLSQS